MTFSATRVSEIYLGRLADRYDFSMPHFLQTWKRRAISQSSLCPGDRVLVYCCGTGLDFEPILGRIGESGKIVGVDFSPTMLAKAVSLYSIRSRCSCPSGTAAPRKDIETAPRCANEWQRT